MSEFSLIERYFRETGSTPHAADLSQGDDAAVLQIPEAMQVVMSIDTLVSGIHFPVQTSAADLAYKALAVNLSDLAAMAATPAWFLLSLTIPDSDEVWLTAFSQSLKHSAEHYQVELIGGDTCRGPLSITIQMTGLVKSGRYRCRSGAKPGDLIVVSGVLGNAALGLAQPQLAVPRHLQPICLQALRRPTPRLQLGPLIAEYASSAIDLSDGLLGDLKHILTASQVGAIIRQNDLPVNDWIKENRLYHYALSGGDDYELCWTMNPRHHEQITHWNRENPHCLLHEIGEITEAGYYLDTGEQMVDLTGAQGYQHFGP